MIYRDQRGVAAIEFAVIASILVALLFGAYDLANAAQQRIALQEAVRAGGQYAMHFPTNPGAVKTVVKNALPSGWNLSTSDGKPVVTCSCGGVAYADCSSPPSPPTCTDSMPMLVTVTGQMASDRLTPIGLALLPANFTATYVTRFR